MSISRTRFWNPVMFYRFVVPMSALIVFVLVAFWFMDEALVNAISVFGSLGILTLNIVVIVVEERRARRRG